MWVYLAARFSRKLDMQQKAAELRAADIFVCSRWLDENASPEAQLKDFSDAYHKETAETDTADIDDCDVLILFTESERYPRNGRMWEAGFAYGLGKTVVTVGPRENIFHYLDDVQNFATWEQCKQWLLHTEVSKAGTNGMQPAIPGMNGAEIAP